MSGSTPNEFCVVIVTPHPEVGSVVVDVAVLSGVVVGGVTVLAGGITEFGCLVPTMELVFQHSSGLVGSMEFHDLVLPDSLILSSKVSPNQILLDILGTDLLAVKAICCSSLCCFWRDFGM